MQPATPSAVHNAERAEVADLLDRFIAGSISVERFTCELGEHLRSGERGTAAVAEAWHGLGEVDLFAWWRTVRTLPPDQQRMLRRCRLFLHTSVPYEWPDVQHLALAELGRAVLVVLGMAALGNLAFAVVMLMLGLWLDGVVLIAICAGAGTGSIVGYRALGRWKGERWVDCTAAGDIDVWPFLRRVDYERALAAIAPREGTCSGG